MGCNERILVEYKKMNWNDWQIVCIKLMYQPLKYIAIYLIVISILIVEINIFGGYFDYIRTHVSYPATSYINSGTIEM